MIIYMYICTVPLERNTSNWLIHSSFSAERGFSFLNNATIYFDKADGSASHLERIKEQEKRVTHTCIFIITLFNCYLGHFTSVYIIITMEYTYNGDSLFKSHAFSFSTSFMCILDTYRNIVLINAPLEIITKYLQ